MGKKPALSFFLFIAVMLLVAAGSYRGGFMVGRTVGEQHPKTLVVKGIANMEAEGVTTTADFATFWQAWQLIGEEHVNGATTKDQEKVYGAIRGLVGSLGDPYTDFFNPEESKKFYDDIQGSFSGIGAEIGFKNNQLVIIAPLKDTPASRSGLKAGDIIVKIGDVATDGLSLDRAIGMIRGKENTDVTLLVFRDEWNEPKEFTITRAVITVPTLEWEMRDGDIAYVSLHAFNAHTSYLFANAALEMRARNARGIVLDLRGNPGGYLDTAVDIAGWFLKKGDLVVSEVGRDGVHLEDFYLDRTGQFSTTPTVVLINAGSASASEILAGALRDNRKIALVGEKSFGKGTVQKLETLADGSSLKITVARWVLPSGKILEGEGIDPDVAVPSGDSGDAGEDPQVKKALELMRVTLSATP